MPNYAGNLSAQIALESRARQQDFDNGYFGSQIAPNWTGMLQGLHEAGVGKIQGGPGGLPPSTPLGWGPPSMTGEAPATTPHTRPPAFAALADYTPATPGEEAAFTPARKASRKALQDQADTTILKQYPGAP